MFSKINLVDALLNITLGIVAMFKCWIHSSIEILAHCSLSEKMSDPNSFFSVNVLL